MSREALRRFTQLGVPNPEICQSTDDGDEDVNMGIMKSFNCIALIVFTLKCLLINLLLSGACMRKLNVTHGDSRDEKERKRFFPFTPQDHLIPSKDLSFIPNTLSLSL